MIADEAREATRLYQDARRVEEARKAQEKIDSFPARVLVDLATCLIEIAKRAAEGRSSIPWPSSLGWNDTNNHVAQKLKDLGYGIQMDSKNWNPAYISWSHTKEEYFLQDWELAIQWENEP